MAGAQLKTAMFEKSLGIQSAATEKGLTDRSGQIIIIKTPLPDSCMVGCQ